MARVRRLRMPKRVCARLFDLSSKIVLRTWEMTLITLDDAEREMHTTLGGSYDLNIVRAFLTRFATHDVVLISVFIPIGVLLGIALWHTGYFVLILLPFAAVILGLIGAALAQSRRYLTVFC
jgi:hypothetical protein